MDPNNSVIKRLWCITGENRVYVGNLLTRLPSQVKGDYYFINNQLNSGYDMIKCSIYFTVNM